MAQASFALVMLAIAGIMALVLGVVGIYGVIAYAVTQRTREIGIRVALGAPLGALQRMFVRHGLGLAGVGIACGLAAAAAPLASWRRCSSTSARSMPRPTRRRTPAADRRRASQLRSRASRDRRGPGEGASRRLEVRIRGSTESARFRQSDRLADAPERFLKRVRVLLRHHRHVVEQRSVGQERRVDADALLAAERRRIDERRRERRSLGDPRRLLRTGERSSGLLCATAFSQAFVASCRSRDAAFATPNSTPWLNTVCPLS